MNKWQLVVLVIFSVDTHHALSSSIFSDLIARERLTPGKYRCFYTEDPFGKFGPLNKKTLLDAFPKREKELSAYLGQKTVDLNSEEDLKKLPSYFTTN